MKIVIELTPGTDVEYARKWVRRLRDGRALGQFSNPRGYVYNDTMEGYRDSDDRPKHLQFTDVALQWSIYE